MPSSPVELIPVDGVELTTLVDNTIDALLTSTERVRRAPRDPVLGGPKSRLRAEHGFSMLVTIVRGGARQSLLFDAGLTVDCLVHNADILDVTQADLRAIVLSHGHGDHTMGLIGMLQRRGRRRLPLVIHPGAFRNRRLVFPDGREVRLPPPSRADLAAEDVEVVERSTPSYLLDGSVLVTGEISRVSAFERGFPGHQVEVDGRWEPDPWIHDDQAIVMRVRDEGLVVLTGCGHAGVVNILTQATSLTGESRLHAVLGGFHLTGGAFDPLIPETVAHVKSLAPAVLVPGHCTGWKATHALAREMPEAFVQNSVGTTFVL
jgi:7,8-dihydropterin-6-yl-methyl-4-(beta-D-ribofuranosyl)aminobenzene 5'-phosphate synthase